MPSVSNFQTALEGTLVTQISAAATTATVKVKKINGATPTWLTTAHRITIIQKSRTVTKVEVVDVAAGTTQSGTTVTLGTMTRGLPLDGTGFTGSGTPQVFTSGAKVIVTWDAQAGRQTAFKDVAQTFSALQTMSAGLTLSGTTATLKLPELTTTQRDNLTPTEGMLIKNSTTGTIQSYTGGAWASVGTDATANGSTTVAGKFEEATVAEQGSATATGATGARLVPAVANLVKTSSGASDENKIPVLNASGQLASGFVDTSGLAVVPTGAMFQWLTDTAPTGYLLCYGQAVSRSTYATLFGVISTTYGVGDNSTTFNLPDLRGRFPLGQDDMGGSSANRVTATEADTLGSTHGAETITLTDAEVPAQSVRINNDPGGSGSTTSKLTDGTNSLSITTANVGAGSSYTTEGGGGAHNNMPPNITVNYIIKT